MTSAFFSSVLIPLLFSTTGRFRMAHGTRAAAVRLAAGWCVPFASANCVRWEIRNRPGFGLLMREGAVRTRLFRARRASGNRPPHRLPGPLVCAACLLSPAGARFHRMLNVRASAPAGRLPLGEGAAAPPSGVCRSAEEPLLARQAFAARRWGFRSLVRCPYAILEFSTRRLSLPHVVRRTPFVRSATASRSSFRFPKHAR